MSKRKSIIGYEKLTIEQKKELLQAFPEGFAGATTKMTNPINGEVMEALLWETDDIIYLVKLPKQTLRPSNDDDDEEFEDEEFDKFEGEDDDSSDDEEDDNYGDEPADEEEDEDED